MLTLHYRSSVHSVENDCPYYAHAGQEQEFWEVWADEYRIAEYAEPFTAEDTELTLRQCLTCGYCGIPAVSVRRSGKQVVWFDKYDAPYQEAIWPHIQLDPIAVAFEMNPYANTLGKGNPKNLPVLSERDWAELTERLQELIQHRQVRTWNRQSAFLGWPQAADVFQRTPTCERDWTGLEAVKRLTRGILSMKDGLQARTEPPAWSELRIKLTHPDFPEAIWRVGATSEGLAFCFLAYPLFPIWCGHERLDAEFDEYYRQTLPL